VGQGIPQVIAHILDTPEITSLWGPLKHWISRRQLLLSTGMPPPESMIDTLYSHRDLESFGFSLKIDSPIFGDGPLRINGSLIEQIQVKHLPGHSPGSIGLIVGVRGKERLLLCGDCLLYPITPIPDDLLVYLRTLQDLGDLEGISLVLPAHGKIIRNLKTRVSFMKKHHRRRLRLTYRSCLRPKSVWDLATMPRYFNTYVNPNKFNPLAGMEALMHVELLSMVGALFRSHIRGGVHYFRNSGEPFEDVYGRVIELVENREIRPILRY
jgi:glyoxylase-like metal-dependent hydrolase (beta-lactamase superfamily II)